MAEYFPPTEDLPTFDVLVFREANDVVPYATSSGGSNQVNVQTDNSATPYYPLFSLSGSTPAGIARTLYNDPSVTPLSYVPSTSTLTATTFSGNVNISDTNSSGTVYPTLVGGVGSRSLQIDSGLSPLSYVPSTGTLTTSTFSGALSGTATNANNVNLTVDNSATTYYPVFAASGAGNKPLLYDTTTTSLAYTPNTGTLIPEILQARANSQINQMFLGSKNGASIFFGIGSNIPLSNLTTGDFNVGIGGNCLDNLRAGSNNFAMGFNNGRNLRNSSNNCFMGHRAGLVINSNGSINDFGNVAVGDTSLTNIDASQYNTGVGADTGLDMLNNNTFCSAIGGRANVGNGLSYATAIGAFANCVTSNTVQLGRAADNVNMPNTMSISGLASFFGGGEFYLVCPQTPVVPAFANDLCNKTYVDAIAPANINVTADNSATTHYPVFVTGTGSQPARIDNGLTPLSYVPSTGTLTTTTFSGALSGTASLATQVNITNASPGAFFVTFVDGTGSRSLFIDNVVTPLTYDPVAGKLSAFNFTGSLTGNADTATNASLAALASQVSIGTDNSGSTWYPTFVASTGGQTLRIDNGLTPLSYQADIGQLTATTFNGSATQVTLSNTASGASNFLVMSTTNSGASSLLTDTSGATYDSTTNTAVINISGNAGSVIITDTDINASYYPVFVSGSGGQPLNIDLATTPLSYNPNSGLMTVRALTGVGNIAGRTGATPLALSSVSGNTTDLIIRHNNAATTSNILIHTTGASGGSVILRTNGATGKGLTITTDGATTFDYPEIFLTAFTGAPSLGLFGFGATPVDGTNIVSGYNACRSTFTANGNNTLYGSNIGTGMLTTTKNNTVVGFNSGAALTSGGSNTLVGSQVGALITTGIENTAMGQGALSSNIGGTDNTCLGFNAGSNITGSSNICIGTGSAVPTAANSNQIAIGTINETMYIQGGLRFYMPPSQLTATATLPRGGEVLPFFYAVNVSTAGQTFTLPSPVDYNGHMITFKRKANNVQYTMASLGGGTRFTPISSITNVATITVTTAIFQQTMISDGSSWCVISQA